MDHKNFIAPILLDYQTNFENFQEMGASIQALLGTLLRKAAIEPHTISHRVKTHESLKNKIEKKQKYKKLNDITDILGFRIVTYYTADILEIEKIIIKQFKIDKKNSIDKTKSMGADRFGYMSLHYIVSFNKSRSSLPEYANFKTFKFEIQIRTILQHAWAEIEHKLGYKSNKSMPIEIKRMFSILSGNLELIDKQFLDIKNNILQYEQDVSVAVQSENANSIKEISLNSLSLKQFLLSNKPLNETYSKYCELMAESNHYPRSIIIDEAFYESSLRIFQAVNVTTLEKLQELSKKYSNPRTIKIIDSCYKMLRPETYNCMLIETFALYYMYIYAYENNLHKKIMKESKFIPLFECLEIIMKDIED